MNNELSTSAKRVQDFLSEKGFSFNVKEFPASTRTSQDAANAIGCEVGQIAKSLVFKDTNSNQPILIIASGSNRVDANKVQQSENMILGKANGKFVKEKVGFAIGGIPPVAHNQPLQTLLDEDLKNTTVSGPPPGLQTRFSN